MTGTTASSPRARFFIGSAIEHRSEVDVLQYVNDYLAPQTDWAFIFANVSLNGRQIDCIVATASLTLLIEAKTYHLPVSGANNGTWTQQGPFGSRPVTNGYQQALGAKNALRDAMRAVAGVSGYPNAMVAVTSGVSAHSTLTRGDFKARVGNLVDLGDELGKSSGAVWTEETWRCFAASMNLAGR